MGKVDQMEDVLVALGYVIAGIRKMANWKAPGPDGVRHFSFKKFRSLHTSISGALQSLVLNGEFQNDW